MFAKIRLQLHSTVHVSGVVKYLPLRSADSFRFAAPVEKERERERKREKEREREETSTTFRSISGFALPSVIHNNLPPPPCAVLLVESY